MKHSIARRSACALWGVGLVALVAATGREAMAQEDEEVTSESTPRREPAAVPSAAATVSSTTAAPTVPSAAATVSSTTAVAPSSSSAPPRPIVPPAPAAVSTATQPMAAVAASVAPSATVAPDVHGVPERSGLIVSGYAQVQFVTNQQSEDQLRQGGQPINLDQFMVRRGRLRVDRRWEWAAAAIEFDGSTTRGAFFGVRRAEGSLIYQGPSRPGEPPLGVFTVGLTEVPFGFELNESARLRIFMERSTASLAYFPGEPDVGARLQGGLRWFRYAVGLYNGQPFDDRAGSTTGRDPTKGKDFVARLGIDTAVDDQGKLRLAGGLSVLRGQGFSPGQQATKDQLVFEDLNENGVLDAGETKASGGSAATPSQTFARWAVAADLRTSLRWRWGLTRLFGEVSLASNLDRGLFFVDPVQKGSDFRHFGANVAILHELPWFGILGARFDYFDPNIDFLDQRAGRFVPADSSIMTISPIIGVHVPDRARLLVQYDFVRDSLGRSNEGVLTDLRNDQLTVRLQVEL